MTPLLPLPPPQVHIFIPKASNPFAGLSARFVVKDHLDNGTGRAAEVWVDGNGLIGSDQVGGVGGAGGRGQEGSSCGGAR